MTDRQDPRFPAGPPEDVDPEYSAYDDAPSTDDERPVPAAHGAYLDDSDAFEPDLRAEVAAHYATEQPGIPAPRDEDGLADLDLDAESAEDLETPLAGEPVAAHLPSSAYDDDFRDFEPTAPDAVPGEVEADADAVPASAELAAETPPGTTEHVEGEEPEPVESVTATALAVADADAASDLARTPRMSQYRSQRRRFTSMFITALVMIALGALFLSVTLTPELGSLPRSVALGITAMAVALSLIGRFVFNGRRERGLFALGVVLLLWTGVLALIVNGNLAVGQGWPLGVAAVGAALLLTFVFERNHERGLLLPGFALIVAGIIAMPFGVGLIPREITATLALLWPLLLLIPALALVPLAFRIRTE
ncbi:MAG: hypothetical protein IT323_21870 [Anaerolineae bacterium]|nr:hypothetical protein [Anaerolineae bacterium]